MVSKMANMILEMDNFAKDLSRFEIELYRKALKKIIDSTDPKLKEELMCDVRAIMELMQMVMLSNKIVDKQLQLINRSFLLLSMVQSNLKHLYEIWSKVGERIYKNTITHSIEEATLENAFVRNSICSKMIEIQCILMTKSFPNFKSNNYIIDLEYNILRNALRSLCDKNYINYIAKDTITYLKEGKYTPAYYLKEKNDMLKSFYL